MQCATAIALLTMLWCVSVAPLGAPVVPLVNWMLIGSWQRSSPSFGSMAVCLRPSAIIWDQFLMPDVVSSPIRTTQRSDGSFAASWLLPTPRLCSSPR